MNPGSKEAVFRGRVLEILTALALQYPSLSVTVDLWRLGVINGGDSDYPDDTVEKWIRIAENVPAFFVSTAERWYQKEEGIIRMNVDWVITPALYNMEPSDHVIIGGEPWMVVETAEQAGISKLKIDKVKSRFVAPSRSDPTYRQMSIRARIV
jgi:hypothetical protein